MRRVVKMLAPGSKLRRAGRWGWLLPIYIEDYGPTRLGTIDRSRTILTVLLLISTGLLGGNGSQTFDLCNELLAVLLLFSVFATPNRPRHVQFVPTVIAALICLLPLAQLMPISLALWKTLPGHAMLFAVQIQTGALSGRHTLSVDPSATAATATRLLPGIAMFLSVLRAYDDERRRLAAAAIAVALFSAALGVVQFSTGALYLYTTVHEGSAVGIFVNRNHDADLLIGGMFLVAAIGRAHANTAAVTTMLASVIVLLALCVLTTTSRMGTAIMAVSLLVCLTILLGRLERWRYWWAGLACVALMVGLLLFSSNPVVEHTLQRYAQSDQDGRYDFWTNSIVAAKQFWPTGSGLGTFVPVYASVENLDTVQDFYVNHAHNEYLELAMEAGAASISLIGFVFATLFFYAWRAVQEPDWPLRVAGFAIAAVLAAHSFVDYPLRTLALSTIFGLASGLLVGAGNRSEIVYAALHQARGSVDLVP